MFLWSADDMSSRRGADDMSFGRVQMTCHPEGVWITYSP